MYNKKKKYIIYFYCLILIIIFLYNENNDIKVSKYKISNKKIPKQFNGYKILHISDLHIKKSRHNQNKLVNIIKNCKPDLIAVTGDSLDSRNSNGKILIDLLVEIRDIAPIYLVFGNHEYRINNVELEKKLKFIGINVLRNENKIIKKEDKSITLVGVDDLRFEHEKTYSEIVQDLSMSTSNEEYKILLAHRPEKFELYSYYKYDLVLSGHAHGGQIRLPGLGGIIAPHQGLFPEYDAGKYERDTTTMFVSRGVGNSIIPQRLFNKPELILITIYNK